MKNMCMFIVGLFFLITATGAAFGKVASYPNTVIGTIQAEYNPIIAAISPDGRYVYVIVDPYPNAPWYANRNILVIDTASSAVIDTITIGTGHNDLVVSPDGKWAYALNANSHNVMKIDLGTNTVVATVGLNGYLSHLAVSPDGTYLYVAEWFPGTIAEVETSTMNVIRRIWIGGPGHYSTVITPDGKKLYTILFHQNKVAVVDIPSWTVSWITIQAPYGAEMAPGGDYLYVCQTLQPSTVSVINTTSDNVIETIQVGPATGEQMAITPNGRYLYLPFPGEDSVGAVDISSGSLVTNIPVGDNPWGIAISSDGNYAYVTNTFDGTVSVIGNANHPPIADAGPDQTLEATSPAGAEVTLDGSGSSDPDADPLTYTWRKNGTIVAGPTTSPTSDIMLSIGVHPIELTVDDGKGGDDTDEVTITVGESIWMFGLYAEREVKLEDIGASDGWVGSNGKIIFENECGTISGSVRATGRIEVGGSVTIDGDLTTNDEVDVAGDLIVTETITEHANFTPFAIPSLSFTAGGDDFTVPEYGAQSLDPGAYGKVKVNKYATLLLSGGEYSIEVFDTDPHSAVSFDLSGGPITINVTNELDIDEYVEMQINPAGSGTTRDITINSLEDSRIKIENDARVLGTLIAPNAKVKMEDNSAIKGAIYADRISIDAGGLFLHHSASGFFPKRTAPEAEPASAQVPMNFTLYQNYPNPFNPETKIRFMLPEAGHVTLRIYDLQGKEIITLRAEPAMAGDYSALWNGKDATGHDIASGIYFYRLEVATERGERFVATKKMSLLR